MKKTIFVFAALILALLLLFQISKYSIISGSLKVEIVIAVIAIVFFIIGMNMQQKGSSKRQDIFDGINHDRIRALDITTREYEVLQCISQGFSNKEIANKLFLSESTIKTHVSNLLLKLNAKRRTQALQIAKQNQII